MTESAYPVTFSVDYPDRPLNRLTTFFRIFTIIPIAIVLALMTGPWVGWEQNPIRWVWPVAGVLFAPTLLMVLFRRKYPRWWFDWNLNLTRFGSRVGAYGTLLTDVYPSTDAEQSVHLEITYPDAEKDLLPGLPLVKWFLAIPHYFVLVFLGIAAGFCIFIAWWAILFTGKFPRAFFDFVVGVGRWGLRVSAYAFILATDRYPPFSLQ
jgi:hypothetical protein